MHKARSLIRINVSKGVCSTAVVMDPLATVRPRSPRYDLNSGMKEFKNSNIDSRCTRTPG